MFAVINHLAHDLYVRNVTKLFTNNNRVVKYYCFTYVANETLGSLRVFSESKF